MSQPTGTAFGIGTPTSPFAQSVAGLSPYAGQALAMQPFPQQLYGQTGPYGIAMGPSAPLQQIAQLLQILPQQLQQVQLLQQQQLAHLQQLLQWVPAQLQQLQQLIQVLPHQVQQLQQQGTPLGAGSFSPFAFGLVPQPFSGQMTSQVM